MNTLVKILIVLVVAFIAVGVLMVFTASGTYSLTKFNSLYFLFNQHFYKVIATLVSVYIFSKIPYDKYRGYSKWAVIGIIIVLILTLLFAPKINNTRRWFLFFQPSEVAKVILIIHLAVMLDKQGDRIKSYKNGFLYALVWIVLISGSVLAQPNISTSLIIVFTAFTILYVGGARFKHIIATVGSVVASVGSLAMMFEYSRVRILSFINSLLYGVDVNIQVKQAKIALGSGGLLGVGLGHSRQSDLFLPESYGDFIFSILGEETGFVGTVGILFLYLTLFVICLIIAKKSQDRFAQILVFGLGFNILISAFINAGVVTGLFPTTGITLPFISFGGTSIILFGVSVGIIVNVARQTLRTEELRIAQVG